MANDAPFSTAKLFAYHKATGCPVMEATEELHSMETQVAVVRLKQSYDRNASQAEPSERPGPVKSRRSYE